MLSLVFANQGSNKIISADADDPVEIGEIWNGKYFDKLKVEEMLSYVTGNKFNNLEKLSSLGTINAQEISQVAIGNKTVGQDVVVTINGLTWNPVYLSKNTDGDPILTFWLDSCFQNAYQPLYENPKYCGGHFFGKINSKVGHFSLWSIYGWETRLDTYNYFSPENYVYSILMATLGDDSKVYRSIDELDSFKNNYGYNPVNPVLSNFSIILNDYIDTCGKVSWQLDSDSADPQLYNEYLSNYEVKDKHTFSSQLLWIPSTAEIENCWACDEKIKYRDMDFTDGVDTFTRGEIEMDSNSPFSFGGVTLFDGAEYISAIPWTRTTVYGEPLALLAAGNSMVIQEAYAPVRPAFHLNLKKVLNNVKEPTWNEFVTDDVKFGHEGEVGYGDSEDNPYEISNALQLAKLSKDVAAGNTYEGKFFAQTAPIMLSEHEWYPIGSGEVSFAGNYNGKGYAIDGLRLSSDVDATIMGSQFKVCGLFGFTMGGILKNIKVLSGQMTLENYNRETDVYAAIGGILGITVNNTVLNCKNNADIFISSSYIGNDSSSIIGVGGIVGICIGGNKICNCTNQGNIDSDIDIVYIYRAYTAIAGGVVGGSLIISDEDVNIEKCSNYGTIKFFIAAGIFGGSTLLTGNGSNVISNCYSYGDLNGWGAAGFAALIEGVISIKNCIFSATIKAVIGAGFILQADEVSISNCIVQGNFIAVHLYDGSDTIFDFYLFNYGENAEFNNCAVIGYVNNGANILLSLSPNTELYKGCYVYVNDIKKIIGADGFLASGDTSSWGVVKGLNSDLPLPSALVWAASIAPPPEGYENVLDYLHDLGFEDL